MYCELERVAFKMEGHWFDEVNLRNYETNKRKDEEERLSEIKWGIKCSKYKEEICKTLHSFSFLNLLLTNNICTQKGHYKTAIPWKGKEIWF